MNLSVNKIILNCLICVCIVLAAWAFENHKQMSPVFTVPFFSGAANFTLEKGWKYAPEEVKTYKSKSVAERESYHFQAFSDAQLISYRHYNPGYLYSIVIATKIFFWAGDVQAVKYFQVLVHIILSLILLSYISGRFNKIIFILLYSFNPLVIYFVTFPFLYFWQVIPAAIFFYLMLKKFQVRIFLHVFIGILLGFCFIVRPTVLFIIVFIFVLLLVKGTLKSAIISVVLFLSFVFLFNIKAENKSVWHTIYTGIGAYPNPYVSALSDNEAYAVYEKYTGEKLNVSTGGNYYDLTVFKAYEKLLQKDFLKIAKESPVMLLKNAILNFFQSFSLGYFVDYPLWISYLSSFAGLVFCLVLLFKKHYLWILAISLNSLTFTPYFPPIQAYMFGAYILLVGAFIQLLNDFGFIGWLEERAKHTKLISIFKTA